MSARDETSAIAPARILIVDDEPLNVDYLEQELGCSGYVTDSAANGVEALERVAAARPDLILLDVMMPELDGISTLAVLKQDPETRLIPVVLMTALNAVEDRVRGIEAGADDFLSKPVDDRELLARIRTALSQKRVIDETVDALRSTSDYLERYGRRELDVAVLAVRWRSNDSNVPDQALDFILRREREAAQSLIRDLGGIPSERQRDPLVAVFEHGGVAAAVEAGREIVDLSPRDGGPASPIAAVAAGTAAVGSSRASESDAVRWLYGAEGKPVDEAIALARAASGREVVVTDEAASALSERFELESRGDGSFRVGVVDLSAQMASGASIRRVRTILVTDIVGSTSTIESVGDRVWAELIESHERAIREELVVFGGEEIDTAGDGFLAAFDTPARAIRCALAVRERSAALGLALRIGIHTGEVEEVNGKARGLAVHLASRIASRARNDELLVSATTRELAAGSGAEFADRGEHPLKGVAEPRRLYAVVGMGDVAAEVSPRRAPKPPAGLTPRELDVLRLVALGYSDADVATRLFLSVRTVNAHLRSIYRKIGVRSRAAAGRFAEENDLL